MNPVYPKFTTPGSRRFRQFAGGAAVFAAASVMAAPPLSRTMTGVFVGNSPASVTAYEAWFGRDVDSVLVFTGETYWENWQSTIGWLKGGGVLGGVDRPLVWSLPLFPRDGSYAFAASPIPERRWQAESAIMLGTARIVNDTKATPPTTSNVVYFPSTESALEFTGLPASERLRVHYYASVPGTMTVLVNGEVAARVPYAATRDPGNASNFVYRELPLNVSVPEGGTLRLQNDGGSVWKTDYLAVGNYAERYRAAATALATFRPQDPVVFVRPGWEFNGDWYPWSGGNGNAENFAAAFRTFVDAFRSVSDRFRFDWNPNFGTGAVDPELCYPGDAYVDVIGMDLYDSEKNFRIDDPAARWDFYVNHPRGLEWLRRFAGERNKLIGLSEWGVSDHNLPDHAGETRIDDNPEFVRRLHAWMAAHGVIYHHYWDSTASYDGRLRDNVPLSTANQYVLSFSTPVPLNDGTLTPPANGSDEFGQSVPRAQWRFRHHDLAGWSLTARPGALRLRSSGGELAGAANSATNVVIQAAPAGDFEIVTRLYGRPAAEQQQCGLVVYGDDDNYLKLVRSRTGWNRFAFAREVDGVLTSGQSLDLLGEMAYLKIRRTGDTYRGYVSADGRRWWKVGDKQPATLAAAKVGLVVLGPVGLEADFDQFIVNKVEAEHGDFAGSAAVDPVEDATASGSKFVAGLDGSGAAVTWLNVPGGSGVRIRYRAASDVQTALDVDGQWTSDVRLSATPAGEFGVVEIERSIAAGATVALRTDEATAPWELDALEFVTEARFEAEEAALTGATTRDPDAGASQEAAIAWADGAAGSADFAGLNAGLRLRLRYRAAGSGALSVYVNGHFQRQIRFTATPSATEPAKFVFEDLEALVLVPPGGSLRLQHESGPGCAVDYVVIR